MSVWDGYRGECHCACVQWCNGMSLTCYPVPCENKCLSVLCPRLAEGGRSGFTLSAHARLTQSVGRARAAPVEA